MILSPVLRGSGLLGAAMLLTACDEGLEVRFAQPFPEQAADMAVFPARHRAVYTAEDSNKSLCIGRTAVWQQELVAFTVSRHQLDSLHRRLAADSTYEEGGHLHYLKLVGRDSVRDSWLGTDTIFTLRGPEAGKLRRFQGRYYLSTPTDSEAEWKVERLEIDGRHLHWQQLGQDTLRLLALNPATVRHHREHGRLISCQLTPVSGAETRRVGRYAGLWDTRGEYARRH